MLEVLVSQLVLGFLCSTRWRIVLLKDEHGVLLLENSFSRLLEMLVQQINVNMAVHFVLKPPQDPPRLYIEYSLKT